MTHSNTALNDLFMKIMQRDIDPRHLVRLGSGSKKLETERDFFCLGKCELFFITITRIIKTNGIFSAYIEYYRSSWRDNSW